MPDKTMDLKGLACPLPILKAKKALSEPAEGGYAGSARYRPGFGRRLHGLQRSHRQPLVEHSEAGGVYRFVLQHSA